MAGNTYRACNGRHEIFVICFNVLVWLEAFMGKKYVYMFDRNLEYNNFNILSENLAEVLLSVYRTIQFKGEIFRF